MNALARKIRAHNWSAEPDDSRAMLERLEILRAARQMPLKELVKMLKELPEPDRAQIIRLMTFS